MSPLHFQREFTRIVISDYNCSLLHLAKRLQITQAQLWEISYAPELNQETSYAQTHKQETSIQTKYKEICLRLNTWYTISGVHNANQIQTLVTLEFLKYELW